MLTISNIILIPSITAILASLAGSMTGTFIAVKNTRFISGSINHAILGGIGLSIWLSEIMNINIPSHAGAILAVIISSFVLGEAHINGKDSEDAASSSIWIIGSAIGILFTSITKNGPFKIMDALMGSMLYASEYDIMFLLIVNTIVGISIFKLYNHISLMCLDEQFASNVKLNTKALYIYMSALFGLSAVSITMTAGSLLSLSFLIIPPTIALRSSRSLKEAIIKSSLISCIFSMIGISIAFYTGASLSACIAIVSGVFYLLSFKRKA